LLESKSKGESMSRMRSEKVWKAVELNKGQTKTETEWKELLYSKYPKSEKNKTWESVCSDNGIDPSDWQYRPSSRPENYEVIWIKQSADGRYKCLDKIYTRDEIHTGRIWELAGIYTNPNERNDVSWKALEEMKQLVSIHFPNVVDINVKKAA
jgi:hypothetical protein